MLVIVKVNGFPVIHLVEAPTTFEASDKVLACLNPPPHATTFARLATPEEIRHLKVFTGLSTCH
jgi:hypothetical protein